MAGNLEAEKNKQLQEIANYNLYDKQESFEFAQPIP